MEEALIFTRGISSFQYYGYTISTLGWCQSDLDSSWTLRLVSVFYDTYEIVSVL